MFERLTRRTESGIAYTKIPANPSDMIDVGECYTGRIIDRIAAYEDTGLTPEEVQKIANAVFDALYTLNGLSLSKESAEKALGGGEG